MDNLCAPISQKKEELSNTQVIDSIDQNFQSEIIKITIFLHNFSM